MSFLKRLRLRLTQRKFKGTVYDLDAAEVGEIAGIRHEGENTFYDVLSKNTKLKLSFPAKQFFVGETGKVYLLPMWSYQVRVSNSKLLDLRTTYLELNIFANALDQKMYTAQLISMMKSGVPYGEDLIGLLPNFEELLIKLKEGKKKVIDETSQLMTLRLLEFGRKSDASLALSPHLTKKAYSLKIINLRRRYANISRLIGFVSELYRNAKDSLAFLKALLDTVNSQLATHSSETHEIQNIRVRANQLCTKRNDMLRALDNLLEVLVIEPHKTLRA